MPDLIERLRHSLGETYRIAGELSGGGMSRVFRAEEIELERQVVIKVLPPEMAAGVNKERFEREIKLAASLQHPHIVPVLTAGVVSAATAGSGDDLLYYVMPYIEGLSLRAKLEREGELPVPVAAAILRDVTDALSAAHAKGVVHRDIKPENVLITGNHAVVTDFGVAKAVTASSGSSSSITSIGVALGTPTYMAPEQAAADPHTDHRADVYAVGTVAYEMVAGRPPFAGGSPQTILAAHVNQVPAPVTDHRSAVPPALAELIMRCLEKRPADRWQTVDEMIPVLTAMTTPTAGITPTGTQPTGAVAARPGRRPVRVAMAYAVAGVVLIALSYAVMLALGLPDWVLAGSVVLVLIGAPLVVVTGHHEQRRLAASTAGLSVPTAGGIQRHLTWRKTLSGGVLAFAFLGLATGGYMGLRAVGLGPGSTLLTEGMLEERDQVVLAAFDNHTADSTLGETVTELFRIDLSQSPAINVIGTPQIAAVLRRMEVDADARLTATLATEVAQREGFKAVIGGEIRAIGGENFVVTATMTAAATGEALLAERVTASSVATIVEAVDELSARLRERIGESLRTIRSDPPLDQVTTRSLEALRKYAQAQGPFDQGDYRRAADLLEDALRDDSTFAMAHRKLGVSLNNMGGNRDSSHASFRRAFALRDRLTERERYLAEAIYYEYVEEDLEASVNAYRTVLEKYPTDPIALNNLANDYQNMSRWDDAAELYTRSIELGGAPAVTYSGGIHTLGHIGDFAKAAETTDRFADAHPGNPSIRDARIELAGVRRDYDAVLAQIDSLEEEQEGSDRWEATARFYRTQVFELHGRRADANALRQRDDAPTEPIGRVYGALNVAEERLWYEDDVEAAAATIDSVIASDDFAATEADDRPYQYSATLYARAGRPDAARRMLQLFEAETTADLRSERNVFYQRGYIALAEGRAGDALDEFRAARDEDDDCELCHLFEIGLSLEALGRTDSAIVVYEAFVDTPAYHRLGQDTRQLPEILRRLGRLHEARGNLAAAADYYTRFVTLWEDADEELQPLVQEARNRLSGFAERGRSE